MKSLYAPKAVVLLIIVNLATILAVLLLKNNLPPVVPLLYGLPQDEAQLVPNYALTVPAAISLVLTIANSLLSLTTKSQFIPKMLLGTSATITILSTITTLQIIRLVGSF